MISDGRDELDAVLWYIDAEGYWEKLMRDEKLIKTEDRLPDKIIRVPAFCRRFCFEQLGGADDTRVL